MSKDSMWHKLHVDETLLSTANKFQVRKCNRQNAGFRGP